MRLYGYDRSSTSYRVRIALNLKGVPYEGVEVDLREGAQRSDEFRKVNPFGSVPALVTDGGETVVQSLAIFTWLDRHHPEPPLWPSDPDALVRAQELTYAIACDVHAVNNLRVLKRLRSAFGADEAAIEDWYRHFIEESFAPIEARLRAMTLEGRLPFGGPGAFEATLVPQVYNARRYALDLSPYPEIVRIDAACTALDAFARAAPEAQDAAPA
ncbi:maleylacetoacetate isomerase [Parvularcula dongshanensis]|nr:maleylacetoacetate isomerase [Parvularcula dongshanensis]